MRVSRMLGIAIALLSQETVTAKQLAERYEVNIRTIYRDIEALSEAGVPVYTRQGRSGGISLMDGFTVNRAMLSDEEARRLIAALQAMQATDLSDNRALVDKIKALFNRCDIDDWVEIEFSDWSNSAAEKAKFATIKSAVHELRILEIDYISSSGQRGIREICPIKVIFKSKAWYLHAYCLTRKALRLFKLSRIISVTNTEKPFLSSSIPYEPPFSQAWDKPVIHLHLRFQPEALFRLYDEFHADKLEKNSDGTIDVKVSYPEDGWIISYILSFGDLAEVISPEHIRDEILRCSSAIADKYL